MLFQWSLYIIKVGLLADFETPTACVTLYWTEHFRLYRLSADY